jgi:hypothetical protein
MGYFRILRHFHKSLGKITLVWKVNLKFYELKNNIQDLIVKKKMNHRSRTNQSSICNTLNIFKKTLIKWF